MKAVEDLRRELRCDIRELKESVKFTSDACDEVKEIGRDVKELRKEVQRLTETNEELRSENSRLLLRLQELEQYQRANNLEVKGVPLEIDPVEVVKKLGDVVGVPVEQSEIDICHRVHTSRPNEKNIIIRFVHRTKRDALLAKSKKIRMNTSMLGFADTATPLYVNEHLTRENKQLLGAAIARKRTAGWKYVWSSGGRIFARKNDDTVAIRITTAEDLTKIAA